MPASHFTGVISLLLAMPSAVSPGRATRLTRSAPPLLLATFLALRLCARFFFAAFSLAARSRKLVVPMLESDDSDDAEELSDVSDV